MLRFHRKIAAKRKQNHVAKRITKIMILKTAKKTRNPATTVAALRASPAILL